MSLDFRSLQRRRSGSDDSEALKGIPLATESDVAIQAYLTLLTRRSYPSNSKEIDNAIPYISYLKEQCKGIPASLFVPTKGFPLPPNALATNTQIFRALAELAAGIKESPQWSVNDGINALATAGIFRVDLSAEDIAVAAQLVFSMSGWITMLFAPLIPRSGGQPGASSRYHWHTAVSYIFPIDFES